MEGYDKDKARLSDRVLFALELALEQKDLEIAEELKKTLDLAMTRNAGGGEFIERRDYPEIVEAAITQLQDLRAANSK